MHLRGFSKLKLTSSGEGGIRTPGPVTVNGFQDRRIRPLCHLSAANVRADAYYPKKIFPLQSFTGFIPANGTPLLLGRRTRDVN